MSTRYMHRPRTGELSPRTVHKSTWCPIVRVLHAPLSKVMCGVLVAEQSLVAEQNLEKAQTFKVDPEALNVQQVEGAAGLQICPTCACVSEKFGRVWRFGCCLTRSFTSTFCDPFAVCPAMLPCK